MNKILSLILVSSFVVAQTTSYNPSIAGKTVVAYGSPGDNSVKFITAHETWSADETVEVYGKLVVQNGVTLTIEPGVAVRFYDTQTALTAPALVVAKGGTIMAEGTPTHPIVFTSLDDPLDGTFAATEKGLWGGIVILGTATVGEDGGEDFIEGIAAGADWAKYGPGNGAANDTESSGVLKYVSIRHGGADIGDGNELNGLTLGGVGSGTVIENVEVVSNLDDGIELFGGTVNVTNFLAYNCDDDAVDIDEAYSGTIDNVFIALGTGSDNIFEIDGTEDSSGTITGSYTITNVTAYGDSTNTTKNDQLGDQKKNATGTIDDVVLLNFKAAQKIEGIDQSTFDDSELIFKNYDLVKVSGESGYDLDTVFSGPVQTKNGKTESDGTLHVLAEERDFFEFVDAQVANTGANTTVFEGWTLYNGSVMTDMSSLYNSDSTWNNPSIAGKTVVAYGSPGDNSVKFITAHETWSADETVEVYGKLVVQNGVTLTIEPGVAVRFYDTQTALTAPALVVAKGGTIMAEGTPTHPIVFTSLDDPLDGTFAATEKGLWGGIVILGTATVGEDGGEDFIEGIAAGADWAKYGPGNGAANDTESSGVLKYVSIRHGGADIGDGNELNGLTLGGVGSGTVIENVEVVSNLDDGIELFGGTVNVTNFLAYNCDDDAVDIDEAYSGTIDNVFIALGTGSDNIFEIDGTEDSSGTITGSYTITNVTAYGDSTNTTKNDQLGDQKKNATGTIDDVVLLNFKAAQKIEGIDQSTFDDSELIFKNYDLVKVSGESGYDLDTVFSGPVQTKNGKTESDGTLHVLAEERDFFEFVDAQVANTGANENMFRAWTLYANSDMYSLSIEEVFLADQTRVYLYPNPVTNTIHVMGVDSKYFDGIKIYNVKGQVVKSGNESSIDVSDLTRGLYILSVESNNKTVNKRFIKQ